MLQRCLAPQPPQHRSAHGLARLNFFAVVEDEVVQVRPRDARVQCKLLPGNDGELRASRHLVLAARPVVDIGTDKVLARVLARFLQLIEGLCAAGGVHLGGGPLPFAKASIRTARCSTNGSVRQWALGVTRAAGEHLLHVCTPAQVRRQASTGCHVGAPEGARRVISSRHRAPGRQDVVNETARILQRRHKVVHHLAGEARVRAVEITVVSATVFAVADQVLAARGRASAPPAV